MIVLVNVDFFDFDLLIMFNVLFFLIVKLMLLIVWYRLLFGDV